VSDGGSCETVFVELDWGRNGENEAEFCVYLELETGNEVVG
jgi:hypothetical protein